MDLKAQQLGQGEKVAAVSALALFACMFLSWFNFGYVTWSAWEALHYIGPLLAIVIFTTLGVTFVRASGRGLGDVPDGMLVFVLGCLGALAVLFRLIDPVSLPGFEGPSTSASVEAGAFLGLLAAAGVAVGGYLQTDGEALVKLRRLLPSGAPGQGAPPPPPPPQAPAPPAPPELPPLAVPAAEPVAAAPDPAPAPPEPAADAGSAFCEHCGTPMGSQDRFCRKCGQRQSEPGPA